MALARRNASDAVVAEEAGRLSGKEGLQGGGGAVGSGLRYQILLHVFARCEQAKKPTAIRDSVTRITRDSPWQ